MAIISNNGKTFTRSPTITVSFSSPLLTDQTVYIYRNDVEIAGPLGIPGNTSVSFQDSLTSTGAYTYKAEVVNTDNQLNDVSTIINVIQKYEPWIVGVYTEESPTSIEGFCPLDVSLGFNSDFGIKVGIKSDELTGAYTVKDETNNVIFTINHISGNRSELISMASANFDWYSNSYTLASQAINLCDPSGTIIDTMMSPTCTGI